MGPNKPDFNECAMQFLKARGNALQTSQLAMLLDEMYARGFSAGRDSHVADRGVPDRPCHCQNCGWRFMERQLKCDLEEIPNLTERLEPGGEVPIGECPECGSLAYLVKPGEYKLLDTDWVEQNVAKVLSRRYGDGTARTKRRIMDMVLGDDPHTDVAALVTGRKPAEVNQADRDKARLELYELCFGRRV